MPVSPIPMIPDADLSSMMLRKLQGVYNSLGGILPPGMTQPGEQDWRWNGIPPAGSGIGNMNLKRWGDASPQGGLPPMAAAFPPPMFQPQPSQPQPQQPPNNYSQPPGSQSAQPIPGADPWTNGPPQPQAQPSSPQGASAPQLDLPSMLAQRLGQVAGALNPIGSAQAAQGPGRVETGFEQQNRPMAGNDPSGYPNMMTPYQQGVQGPYLGMGGQQAAPLSLWQRILGMLGGR